MLLLTPLFLGIHAYHAYALDVDIPMPMVTVALSLLIAALSDIFIPRWLLVVAMTPYFIVLHISLAVCSATATRGIIVRKSTWKTKGIRLRPKVSTST